MRPHFSHASTAIVGQVVAFTAVIAGIGALTAWVFTRPAILPPTTYAALVLDSSPTSRASDRCQDALGIASELLRSEGEVVLTIYATGDGRSGGEPIRLGEVVRERRLTLMEGAGHHSGNDDALLAKVEGWCLDLQERQESPIFAAVRAAVADLATMPCEAEVVRCDVWVRTDGLEEADEQVITALGPGGALQGSPRIDNWDVSVTFCGISAREVRRRRGRLLSDIDSVARAFRGEMAAPDRARFLPSCPVPSRVGEAASTWGSR